MEAILSNPIFAFDTKCANDMKKILEVLQYGEMDIRFNTDIKSERDFQQLPDLAVQCLLAMTTRLWGGNEHGVLAAIRILALADLAASVNREEMLKRLDEESGNLANILKEAMADFERKGGKVITFGPGIAPPEARS